MDTIQNHDINGKIQEYMPTKIPKNTHKWTVMISNWTKKGTLPIAGLWCSSASTIFPKFPQTTNSNCPKNNSPLELNPIQQYDWNSTTLICKARRRNAVNTPNLDISCTSNVKCKHQIKIKNNNNQIWASIPMDLSVNTDFVEFQNEK